MIKWVMLYLIIPFVHLGHKLGDDFHFAYSWTVYFLNAVLKVSMLVEESSKFKSVKFKE